MNKNSTDELSPPRPYIPGDVGFPPRNIHTSRFDGGLGQQNKPPEEYFKKPLTAGTKYDAGKLPLDLLDPVALEGLTKVLEFGAKKYAAHNWRGGLTYSRLIAAMLRHTFAIVRGERIDPESGLPHIDHVGCCWMFLSNMMKTRTDMDDLHFKDKV